MNLCPLTWWTRLRIAPRRRLKPARSLNSRPPDTAATGAAPLCELFWSAGKIDRLAIASVMDFVGPRIPYSPCHFSSISTCILPCGSRSTCKEWKWEREVRGCFFCETIYWDIVCWLLNIKVLGVIFNSLTHPPIGGKGAHVQVLNAVYSTLVIYHTIDTWNLLISFIEGVL